MRLTFEGLLTGEPGIGKTRTLDELGKRARARGFSVWEGTAYDGGGAPAYWPWIEILRGAHADLSRSMFRQHVASGSWALARLVPELLPVRYGDLGLLCFLAEIYCELSDTSGAAVLYVKLLPFAERNAVGLAFDYGGAVAHYLGMLAALLQRTEQAIEHFEVAERINRQLRMPLQAALSTQLRGQLQPNS